MPTFKRAHATAFGDFSQPDTIQWEEVPLPTPTGSEVLIRIKAAGLNPIDWKVGAYAADMASLPIHPLSDLAGTVTAVGPLVTKIKVGDDVCANTRRWNPATHGPGALAEYALLPETQVGPLPESWSYADAAALPMIAITASEIVKAAKLDAGKHVLVLGASGGVGSMVLALARDTGAKISASASAAKFEHVKRLGGPNCTPFDYKAEDWATKFKDEPPDAVIDVSATGPTGPAENYYKCLGLNMGRKGRFVTGNILDPTFHFGPRTILREMRYEAAAGIRWLLGWGPAYNCVVMNFGIPESGELLRRVARKVAAGEMEKPAQPTVFQPADYAAAYAVPKAGKGGKAVIDMQKGAPVWA